MPKSPKSKHLPWNFILPALIGLILFAGLSVMSIKKPDSGQLSLLFLIHAKESKIIQENTEWKLTLINPDTRVEYFSDRPQRLMGQGSLGQFITLWNEWGFVQNPPNAAISFLGEQDSKNNVMMVSLQDPTYNSDSKELSFRINPLQEIPQSLQKLQQQAGEVVAKDGLSATVFIDNAIVSSRPENQTPPIKTFLSGMPLQEHSFHIHWKGTVLESN
jgi:hypothetical protein